MTPNRVGLINVLLLSDQEKSDLVAFLKEGLSSSNSRRIGGDVVLGRPGTEVKQTYRRIGNIDGDGNVFGE